MDQYCTPHNSDSRVSFRDQLLYRFPCSDSESVLLLSRFRRQLKTSRAARGFGPQSC